MSQVAQRALRSALLFVALLLLNAGCAPAPPTATPTAVIVPTLPPTWTPSPPPTAPPPTATRTPSPRPSSTPTLTVDELCAGFALLYEVPAGAQFSANGVIPLAFTLEAVDAVVRFVAVQRVTGANQGVQFPGGQTVLFELPARLLPGPGQYDWTLGVARPGDDTLLCAYAGAFVIALPTATPTALPAPRRPTARSRPAAE
ncbi:MAG: hypothetical protein ACUVSX_16885 [Aggregatilineales bacterium]